MDTPVHTLWSNTRFFLFSLYLKSGLSDPVSVVAPQVGKDKTLKVTVVKIHQLENPEGETAEKKLEAACDSPSSNKENASLENQSKELPSTPPEEEEGNRKESFSK